MQKNAVLAIGYGAVDKENYYNVLNSSGDFIRLYPTSPNFEYLLKCYNGKVAIVLTGSDLGYLFNVIRLLKEYKYTIDLDILICSYVQGVINDINECLDTNTLSNMDVYGSYLTFIEMLEVLDLSVFNIISIVDDNNERYDPKGDIRRIIEYLHLVVDSSDEEVKEKIKAVINRFADYLEENPGSKLYKLYSEVNILIEFSESRDISLD